MKIKNFMKRTCVFIKENIIYLIVLVATFLSLTVIVGFTFGSFYINSRKDVITIGNMSVSEEAQRIDNSLLFGINTLQVTYLTIDYMKQNGATLEEMEGYLQKQTDGIVYGIDPSFSGIYGVIDGKYVDGSDWEPDDGYNPYERPWYLEAKEQAGKIALVSPYIDAQTDSTMISISQILSDGVSALSLDIKLDGINEAVKEISLNGSGYCFIVDKNGLVVAHHDEEETMKNYMTDSSSDLKMKEIVTKVYELKDNTGHEVINIEIDDDDCMVFSKSVQDEWYVILVVNSSDVLYNTTRSLIRNIVLSVALFIIVGYFYTSNYFNRKRASDFAKVVGTDKLTGLNNRGEFDRFLSSKISGNIEEGFCLVLMDVDKFKSINDAHGHCEGDKALKHIADTLTKVCAKHKCFCARYGGDEFVIINERLDEEEVIEIVEELNSDLRKLKVTSSLPYNLDVSYGISSYHGTEAPSELIDIADHGLYKMKAEKKGKC